MNRSLPSFSSSRSSSSDPYSAETPRRATPSSSLSFSSSSSIMKRGRSRNADTVRRVVRFPSEASDVDDNSDEHLFEDDNDSDYTDEHHDPYVTWYTRNDYKTMQDCIRPIVRAMRQNRQDLLDERGISTRGLEHLRSNAHLEQQIINKDCVVEAVLGEQRRQREQQAQREEINIETTHVEVEIEIANASRVASQWARNQARQFGAADEAMVRLESMERYSANDVVVVETAGGESTVEGARSDEQEQQPPAQPHPQPRPPQAAAAVPTLRQDEGRLNWLSHQDSLKFMADAARNNPDRQAASSPTGSLKQDSMDDSSNHSDGRTRMPQPLGERPPSVEQAFAA